MVSPENFQVSSKSLERIASPRISFSADFLDEENYISISPNSPLPKKDREGEKTRYADFEFLTNKSNLPSKKMLSADELFFEGKLLPFWETHHAEKLSAVNIQQELVEQRGGKKEVELNKEEGNKINWFIDEDPSPRPPTCTVLWKELLRLKKTRASTLSPSSSSSSSNSSQSLADAAKNDEGSEGKREKNAKRNKKGLERTRSTSIRIRPVVNVPICSQGKSSGLPPLFFLRKSKVER
ncbi:hypothetical protein LguiA_030884 [Lonicera macranthoides]